jgi:hypothetical protein
LAKFIPFEQSADAVELASRAISHQLSSTPNPDLFPDAHTDSPVNSSGTCSLLASPLPVLQKSDVGNYAAGGRNTDGEQPTLQLKHDGHSTSALAEAALHHKHVLMRSTLTANTDSVASKSSLPSGATSEFGSGSGSQPSDCTKALHNEGCSSIQIVGAALQSAEAETRATRGFSDELALYECELIAAWSREAELLKELNHFRADLQRVRDDSPMSSPHTPSFPHFSASPCSLPASLKISFSEAHTALLATKIPPSDSFCDEVFKLQAHQIYPLLTRQFAQYNAHLREMSQKIRVSGDRHSLPQCSVSC